jgi:hypothetical protein
MKFDRSKFLTSGVLAAVFGVVAYLIATEDVFGDIPEVQDLVDEFSPLLILVAPVLVIAGIVMIVVGLASSKDDRKSAAADKALELRTRKIMRTEGLDWKAAYRQAKSEAPRPRPEPAQDSPDLEHRLRELKQLHDDGLIDADEYRRKQRTLLDGL